MSISVDARNQSGQTRERTVVSVGLLYVAALHAHTHRGDIGSVVTMIAYGADVEKSTVDSTVGVI